MVGYPSKTNVMEAAAIFMFGCVAILLNYMADLQKEKFRASGGSCHIWGRPAKFVVITFDTRYYILDIYEMLYEFD